MNFHFRGLCPEDPKEVPESICGYKNVSSGEVKLRMKTSKCIIFFDKQNWKKDLSNIFLREYDVSPYAFLPFADSP